MSLPELEGQYVQVDLTLTTNDAREATTSNIVYVFESQPPVADFNCYSPEARQVICNSSSWDDISIEQLEWTLSTGEVFDGESFSHILSVNEDISVDLKVVDSQGLSSNLTKQVDIVRDQPPVVDFSCSSHHVNQVECYNSSNDDMSEVNYTWEILGNSYSQKHIADLDLGVSGNIDIKLTAVDSFGQSSSLTKSVDVMTNSLPIASFECSQIIHTEIKCHSTSIDEDGSITSSKFIVNGMIYEGENVVINLENEEPVEVTLEVVDNYGGVSTVVNEIVVNKTPVPSFACTQQNQSNLILCNAGEIQDENTEELNYSWVLNEVIYTGLTFQVELPYGTHIVTLTVSDSLGAQSILEKEITLYNYNNAPEPMFAHYFEVGNIGMFNGSLSLNGNREVVLYTWFVDGQEIESSSDFSFQYTFADNNEHTVKLVVKDSLDRVAEYEEIVKPYDLEVPGPDLLDNFINFTGVDSDNNGIRDDLQREFIVLTNQNSDLKRYLKRVVQNLQKILINSNDITEVERLIDENKDIYRCIDKIEDENDYSDIRNDLLALNYNSKDRLHFFRSIKYLYAKDYQNESFDCEGVQ